MNLNKLHRAYMANPALESEFYTELLRYIKAIVAHHSHDRCTFYNLEDVITDSALQVWRRMKDFDPHRASFKKWVWTIVLSNIRMAFRQYRRRGYTLLIPEDTASRELPADQRLVLKEFKQSLTRLNREILQLYLDGLTLEEIAQSLNLSLDAIKSRLKRIRKRHF